MLFKIPYTGFIVVEADDSDQALDKAVNDEEIYEEWGWGDPVTLEEMPWPGNC